MDIRSIPVLELGDSGAVRDYFEAGPAVPAILRDAIEGWPASHKWSLAFFAEQYGDAIGHVSLSFSGAESGRATSLRTFIANIDKPLTDLPGFWIDDDGGSSFDPPQYDEAEVWSFIWRPFRDYPELLEDVSPFPDVVPNITASLETRMLGLLQSLAGFDYRSIYIARAGTITPFHHDQHHTIGSLTQFEGSKDVWLLNPASVTTGKLGEFNPDKPDFDRWPRLRNGTFYKATIARGDMLVIPPDWWHYTRSHSPSLTHSRNFFTHRNCAAYLDSVLNRAWATFDDEALLGKLARHLGERQLTEGD